MSGGGGLQDLTARESAVLSAVERRLGNTDIADELHISVRTVESHIASLRRKLAADTRAKLIDAARAAGARPSPSRRTPSWAGWTTSALSATC